MAARVLRTQLIVLLPTRTVLAADSANNRGVLARWCSRAQTLPSQAAGSDAMLRECFDLPCGHIPVAALTRELDGAVADDAVWLRADPAHVRADMVSARLMACGDLGLSTAQSDELVAALKPLFGDAGVPIEAGSPSRWYVRCTGDSGLPEFAAPEVALGDDLRAHLPAGDAGRRWRLLLNEAQILLHQHPLNAKRNARGLPVVNSVWFWGAGRRPDWVRSDARAIVSDDALVQALALRAGVSCDACGSGFDQMAASAQIHPRLLDLRRVFGETLEEAWLGPIDAALRKRRIGAVDLLFRSGERCRVRGSDRWRLWRVLRPLDA